MKKIVRYVLPFYFLVGICMVLSIPQVKAQVPQKFNYQGIARDAKGNPIGKQSLSLKIAVLATEDATVSDYEETQQVTTNEFGLYTLQIGNGTPTASFAALGMKNVKWETGNKYIRVAIDPKGGNDYQVVGTTQLLSVPYAIYADKAGVARETTTTTGGTRAGAVSTSASGTGTTNYLTKFVAANTIFNSQIFDNGTNVGLGTASPSSKFHIFTNAGNQEHLRMENTNPGGWGKFIMYNDNVLNYHTFTKYGSTVAGSYGSGSSLFPYANLMVFGSNNSPTVLANGHNIGFATVNGATATFKFIGVQSTGNVGIGGNATPATNVQINRTDATGDTLKITNNTTGHLATDGLDIRNTGNNAEIMNRENAVLAFGTNNTERARIDASGNVGIGTTTPGARLEVAGQVKITGGAPGVGKVLTSDATGLATWQTPAAGGGGVTSVNGATGVVTQSITMGSTGTNTNIIGSGTNAVTIHIPTANATNTGKLSNTDWTTFNNKANTSTGTTDYVAKYTNGNTIGISKLLDNTSGLAYNYPGQAVIPSFGVNTGITLNNSAQNMILRNTDNTWNYLSVVSPSYFKGFWLLDSSKSFDSITFLHRYEPSNTFSIGNVNQNQFSVRMNDGRMGNQIGNALFTINSVVDTAASFTTASTNYLGNGILRAEFTGTNSSDNIAIYGKSKPTDNSYGLGVVGDGGLIGVKGITNSKENWGNQGVVGYSYARGNSTGVYGYGSLDTNNTINSGTKYGVYGYADGGLTNYGVTGIAADSGRCYGTFGAAQSASDSSFGANNFAYGSLSNIGSFNKATSENSYTPYGALNTATNSTSAAIGAYNTATYTGSSNPSFTYGTYSYGFGGTQDVYGENAFAENTGGGFAKGLEGTGYANTGTAYGVAAYAQTNSSGTAYGIYGAASSFSGTAYAGFFNGTLYATTLTGGTKPFTIDHPLDPENKVLRHSSIESNDMMNLYNGNITTDASGYATVQLPDYFTALNEDFKYQLTVIGTFAQAIIKEEVANNQFVIQTSQPNVKVSWQVAGVRHDAVAKKYPILVEEDKKADIKGKYYEPEAYGVGKERGIGYQPTKKVETTPVANITKSVTTSSPLDMQKEMKAQQERIESQKSRPHVKQETPITPRNNHSKISSYK